MKALFSLMGALLISGLAWGHGDMDMSSLGKPGEAADVDRVVEVHIGTMDYSPTSLQVKAGETVRFVVKNGSSLLHEFNIGTAEMHKAHEEEMRRMMEAGHITPLSASPGQGKPMEHDAGYMHMSHDDPNSVLVEPGKTEELIWHFGQPADLQFACNVPGHYEAGMVGNLQVK